MTERQIKEVKEELKLRGEKFKGVYGDKKGIFVKSDKYKYRVNFVTIEVEYAELIQEAIV